jgi:hypothetical protein
VQVEFDIAEREESQGQSVSQILTSFISDPNLLWMRYLNTMLDGASPRTPSRVAFLEFEGPKQWMAFEQNQKGPTHVLFDIFWLHWRRTPWMTDPASPEAKPITERETGKEGYLWTVKFSVKPDMANKFAQLVRTKLKDMVATLSQVEGFLGRSAYVDAKFQSSYSNYVIYEFANLAALFDALYISDDIFEVDPEVMKCFSSYGASFYQPPYEKGGNILLGISQRKDKEEL